eukprot:771002-Lingulodinium_polyedra.AAC.1
MKRGEGARAEVCGARLGEQPYHPHVCSHGSAKFRPRRHLEVALARLARSVGAFVDIERHVPELYC